MTILHITNDFSGSTVYKNLFKEIDNLGICQIVYTPIRDIKLKDRNNLEFNISNSKIYYRFILSPYIDRIYYKKKIRKIVKDIENTIDLSQIDLIHAHTWFSDGGVAYELNKIYKIPYITNIRNTDLNVFLKYMFNLRNYGKQILLNSKQIVPISIAYKDRIKHSSVLKSHINFLTEKINVIPNGVDKFWIDNRVSKRKIIRDKNNIKMLYVGKFTAGKNILKLIKSIQVLNIKTKNKLSLTLIGGGGNHMPAVLKMIEKDNNIIYIGKINNLNQLRKYYSESDFFLMPSKAETFGLVYIEALLQGLPILYTAHEGIDGFYDESIGEKINDSSLKEIQSKILKLINSKKYFETDLIAKNHNWNAIAHSYIKLYYQNLEK
ncbi:glycosyltransferase family 4 protein [Sphingobacterium sp. SGL-16]|uniref:glycosyltransferase family 4 protein n=1 Tax=Sphingobacterium sp. SGL-16 TaxID=2710883 RepID=UPI0013EDE66A|nr:glycosyltransferase family 4 protein [Sphingobacterium sp. SGL-16]NGM73068.1 glycosyltransferase family 4 protein [Sphingobacterium sp. SGL-16]